MSEKTQNAAILHFLKMGRKLTPLAALRLFGTMRLAARVWELKKDGHRIESGAITVAGKRFAVYWLA
jgi:hypothetical protein